MRFPIAVSRAFDSASTALAAVAGSTRTQRAASVGFAALAALDTFHRPGVVTGTWWLVLLLVWLMPWPPRAPASSRAPDATWSRAIQALLVVAILSWLYVRADSAIRQVLDYWLPFNQLPVGPRALSFPLQDIAVAALTGLLIGIPLHRAFGRWAVGAGLIVLLPWLLTHNANWLLNSSSWIQYPRMTLAHLFEAVIAVLLLMEVCAVLERRAQRRPNCASSRQRPVNTPGNAGRLRIAASAILLLFALAAFVVDFVTPRWTGVLGSAVESAAPLWAVVVTAAFVAFFRTFRRGQTTRFHVLVRISEWPLSLILLGPIWAWALLHAAPTTANVTASQLKARLGSSWTVVCAPHDKTISIESEFYLGIAKRFRTVLDACPEATTVLLSSPGGKLAEAHALARLIKDHRLATRVKDFCESACAYAFAAGNPRILDDGAVLGFHAARETSTLLEWLDTPADIGLFPRTQAVNPDFLRRAAAIPHDQIWTPTNEELLAAGYVTEIRP